MVRTSVDNPEGWAIWDRLVGNEQSHLSREIARHPATGFRSRAGAAVESRARACALRAYWGLPASTTRGGRSIRKFWARGPRHAKSAPR